MHTQKMVQYFVSNASCWRRLLDNDEYEEEAEWLQARRPNVDPDTFLCHVIGKFVHEVYAFGLAKSPYEDNNTKSIYLYISGFRYLKCYKLPDNSIKVECRNESVAEYYRNAFERLANGRWPKLKKVFFEKFQFIRYHPTGYVAWGHFLYKTRGL
jgi:hypothetical protein